MQLETENEARWAPFSGQTALEPKLFRTLRTRVCTVITSQALITARYCVWEHQGRSGRPRGRARQNFWPTVQFGQQSMHAGCSQGR
jgi:hypothetical protein